MNYFSSSPILAKDLMDPEAVPLMPGKFEKGLALQFLSGQYSGWPVVDSTRKILGVVTELRLLQACASVKSLDDLKVEDTMSGPVSVYENDSLDVVMNLMVKRHVLRMPVVDDQKLIGVISRGHVLWHCLPISSSSAQFVFSCAWCERVHDPSDELSRTDGWRDLASFLTAHRLTFSDIDFSQTYCSSCLKTLQALQATSRSQLRDESVTPAGRPCLLVVDDDPAVGKMLSQAIQEWGYDVQVARNGREGLTVVSNQRVDGILLDMQMPVMDGRTMLDELRWLGHQMPVLMMSGGSEERALRQLLQEGAQGFLLKPFHLATLQQVCQEVLQKNAVDRQILSHTQVT